MALADYLEALGVKHVAMESTGVLWKPVWNILDGRFKLLLVNPRHVKQVPGRKSDVSVQSGSPNSCSARCCRQPRPPRPRESC